MATFRSFTFDDDGGAKKSTNFTLVVPSAGAGAEVGDLGVLFIQFQDTTGSGNETFDLTPSGWTEIMALISPRVANYQQAIYAKILTSGDLGSTISVSSTGSEYISQHLFVVQVSGSPSSPLDCIDDYGENRVTSSSNTIVLPSLVSGGADRCAIAMMGSWGPHSNITVWSGGTEDSDTTYYAAAHQNSVGSGTFAETMTAGSSVTYGSMAMLVKDAAAAVVEMPPLVMAPPIPA